MIQSEIQPVCQAVTSSNQTDVLKRVLAETTYHRFPGGRKKIEVLLETIARLAGEHPRVLEVGCGNGSLSFPLAAIGCDLVGADIDERSIESCSARNRYPNAHFVVTDGLLGGVGGSFDLIICAEVLEHLHDPQPLVAAMRDRLAPGGEIFITIPNGYGLREIGGRFEHRLRRSPVLDRSISTLRSVLMRVGMPSQREKYLMHTSNPEQEHVQKFTRREIVDLLRGEGLEISKWRNSFLIFSVFHCREGLSRIEKLDSKSADLLPAAFASGWYFTCRRAPETPSLARSSGGQ